VDILLSMPLKKGATGSSYSIEQSGFYDLLTFYIPCEMIVYLVHYKN
jgi:hypothetical protein